MKDHWYQRNAMVIVALAALLAGCLPVRPTAQATVSGAVDIDAVLKEAAGIHRPVIVLLTETGQGNPDSDVRALLDDPAVKSKSDQVTFVNLDLTVSRNRAAAARFHVTELPILVCLSPRGVIVSRDEKPISTDLILKRIAATIEAAQKLDAKLESLEQAAAQHAHDPLPKVTLADFWYEHQNCREAIPLLAAVAHSETVDANIRVYEWVILARAHLWIAEPEKGRHEARDLMATLGPTNPQAIAGGNLVLGLQDAKAKRYALARTEFESALAAAPPDSVYAKQAAEEMAKLPTPGK